ncbi:MAG: hypothetical protein MK033_12605 [Candidatus Caenarcaniphilales bacterium]|nr:hypothetical protein [Candidatus Caenarcaniphilales bacterium]
MTATLKKLAKSDKKVKESFDRNVEIIKKLVAEKKKMENLSNDLEGDNKDSFNEIIASYETSIEELIEVTQELIDKYDAFTDLVIER